MSTAEKVTKISDARLLARFFELEITLSMFGKVILHYVFPPKDSKS